MAIAIDKNIPIPDGSASKYPFREMEVGDSFFTEEARNRVQSAAQNAGKRSGRSFKVRSVNGGFRVWRVA